MRWLNAGSICSAFETRSPAPDHAVVQSSQYLKATIAHRGRGNTRSTLRLHGQAHPARFKSSKQVGAYFGLTPTKYQSGETDIDGRISKIGDAWVRAVLYEAANIILTKPLKGCTALKSWSMKLARRSGMKKAKVALARKIAVIMHRMLADGTSFVAAV